MLHKGASSLLLAALAVVIGAMVMPHCAAAGPLAAFKARVIHVDDGDTVVAMTDAGEKVTVRLASIDAPETTKNRCKPGQPYSQKAKEALADLVHGRSLDFVCHDVDRYGREVCDLQLDGTTASRELARKGLAWANTSNPRYLRDKTVAELERRARTASLGLWASADSVPPWEWRSTVWRNTCASATP